MKYFLSIFFLCFCLNFLSAQEKHFVFIQSDSKQPFYVSVNGKLYSSTATGYIIIPKLADGSYHFTVGFAQNTFPEQSFAFAIQNKDLGFDLKNFGDKGWGLFNLQSLDITMASAGNTNVVSKALSENESAKPVLSVISFEKKKDAVAPVAVKAVADSSVSNTVAKSEVVKEPAKVDTAIVIQKVAADVAPAVPQTKPVEQVASAVKNTDIKKVSEVAGAEGVHLAYVEGSGKNTDTIHVIIPSAPVAANVTSAASDAVAIAPKNAADTAHTAPASTTKAADKSDVKFLNINMTPKMDTSASVAATTGTINKIMENSNCKNIATDEDYARLRKKMAMETSDEKMISEAKKAYRNKCFTTSQIKGLSTLFLSDEGRFTFFDASFVSVADASQYATLQSEFIDPAFVNRFKTLIQ